MIAYSDSHAYNEACLSLGLSVGLGLRRLVELRLDWVGVRFRVRVRDTAICDLILQMAL